MSNKAKNIAIGVLVLLTLLFGYLALKNFGVLGARPSGLVHYQTESFLQGFQVGTHRGEPVGKLHLKSCDFIGMDVSHAASTTKPYDCAIAGVVSSDKVLSAMISDSVANAGENATTMWSIRSCHASTTAGYVTCDWHNFTGVAKAPAATAGVGSSTPILVGQ